MRVKTTYIHHNCFVLDLGAVTFLFDVPSPEHLPFECRPDLEKEIAGKDLVVFVSHSHADHFDPDLVSLVSGAKTIKYVVSDDVPDLYPDAIPEDALVVEPDASYAWQGLEIETLMSNDLGVAFMIGRNGLRVYYGGDLANWNWDTLGDKGKRMTEEFFQQAVEQVKQWKPQVAFSNVDDRLPGLAGGAEFVQQVQPELFVPMHTFGNTEVIEKLTTAVKQSATHVFAYAGCGATLELDITV